MFSILNLVHAHLNWEALSQIKVKLSDANDYVYYLERERERYIYIYMNMMNAKTRKKNHILTHFSTRCKCCYLFLKLWRNWHHLQ